MSDDVSIHMHVSQSRFFAHMCACAASDGAQLFSEIHTHTHAHTDTHTPMNVCLGCVRLRLFAVCVCSKIRRVSRENTMSMRATGHVCWQGVLAQFAGGIATCTNRAIHSFEFAL